MNEANERVYDFALECMNVVDNNAVLEMVIGNGKILDKLFATATKLKVWGINFLKDMATIANRFNQSSLKEGKPESSTYLQ